MKGSVFAAAPRLQAHPRAYEQVRPNLSKYDQQYFFWGRCISNILCRPNSFLHQRKCEEQEQWIQKQFNRAEATKQLGELVDYYRFYKNSPTLAHPKYLDFMGSYWNKKKSLYYRRIKKQLQIEDGLSQRSAEQHVEQIEPKCGESLWTGTFQLPSHLKSQETVLNTDPDATIRGLLLTMSAKKQHKSTRQVSKIAQFQQKTTKSNQKIHMKTNPSHLVSTSQFKKTKKKPKYKSVSVQPKTIQNKSNEKQFNPTTSFQKFGFNQPQLTLNHQRRNKPKQIHKQSNKKRFSNNKEIGSSKKKETVPKKGKSSEKSVSVLCKSKSGRKSKQVQTSANVRAVIDRVKDKIKAQKSVMLKKYIQSRQSCKSNESMPGETAKRQRK